MVPTYEAYIEDEESDAENDEIEEVITDIEDECALVFDNEANGKMLNEIFDAARANYEKDRSGWKSFFGDLKFELIATDDEDNLRDILSHHLRKARLELS
ncbi:MAG: hypothetical protein WDN47_04575 [Candidatus Doudnabacteria bacterium]